MKKGLMLLFLLLPPLSRAQLSTYKKGEKVGIEFNKEIIAKAKYKEVIIRDDNIATAIKKKKIYYINSEGEVIYKGLKAGSEPFEKGLGLVQDKKGNSLLINSKGENFIKGVLVKEDPVRHGAYVLIDGYLFSEIGLVESEIDSIASVDEWLKVYHTATVTNTKTIRINLFKKEKVKEYSYYPYFNLYQLNENQKLAEDAVDMKAVGDGVLISTADGFSHLYAKNGALIEHSLTKVKSIHENYYSALKDSLLLLINKEKLSIQISGYYTSYEIKEYAIWGISKSGDQQFVDIYKGSVLKIEDWSYMSAWDAERSVFKDSAGQFVAWNNGDIISKKYLSFSKHKGYFMLVHDTASYTWLAADTFEELSFYYPNIIADVPIREERPTGLFSIIPNILHALFGPRESELPTNRQLVDAGHQFYEGWAICQTNVKSQSEPFDSAVYLGNIKKLRYNYINSANKQLNDKKYTDCFPFINGRAWVKEKSDYYLIGRDSEKSGSLHFQSVELDENGLFIVENFGSKGIVNSNYELVVPPRHFRIHRQGTKYYDNFTSDKKLIYEIP